MTAQAAVLETASIQQQCKVLRLPAIAAQCGPLAEQAVRERRSHLGFLEALLQAELEEREDRLVERRLREAHLPRMKTLEEFDFARNPRISAQQIHELAHGAYIGRAEPVIFIGDSGTGKTHLLTGLAVAACRQKRRVRFTTAAALINEMVEAKHQLQLGRALSRWARYDLIALDEVGYVPLAEVGAEFLFQVIAERAEKAAVIVTTNLPFSEWTQVIPNARLCKALIDRITDRACIIETGPKILELASCQFITNAESVIVAGPIGTGKTMLAIALGVEATRRRFRVLFVRAADLVQSLLEARDERTLTRLQQRYEKVALLVVDELGFVPFERTGGELLFNLLAQRYERRATVITTNLAFGEWVKVFGDEKLATSLLDRLTHHSHILTTRGDSYRGHKRKPADDAGAPPSNDHRATAAKPGGGKKED